MMVLGKEMENLNQKTLEKIVSQRALQISSSIPCQICAISFLSVICLTSLFLASLTSLAFFEIGGVSFSGFSCSSGDSSSNLSSKQTYTEYNVNQKEVQRLMFSQKNIIPGENDRASKLYSLWTDQLHDTTNIGKHKVPKAPHLKNCKSSVENNHHFDTRLPSSNFPPWIFRKRMLKNLQPSETDEQPMHHTRQIMSEDASPPWVTGSNDENYPLTRRVQRDIWLHQHPQNCSDPNVKFLIADWERLPGLGMGAQFASMCGLLAIAITEKRVLVTNYYNRADHDGCKGSSRASWSCYFLPETSQQCRERAFNLMHDKDARQKGIIAFKDNYTSKEIWAGRAPRLWGNPWIYMQPTTEINGSLIYRHRKMDRRWWRSQAIRYLMRFQTEYTCNLLNIARHEAFGREAAKLVIPSSFTTLAKHNGKKDIHDIVWSDNKPWIPRPLLSMHVRMGDKASEMDVVGFEEYMRLAQRIRISFPHLNSMWLSTEMQEVIDKTKLYPDWKFYHTDVKRQLGNTTMASYETSLGRETSTNYPLVNFLMATEADFFVGALGSTWCFFIDSMRNTGGKVMSGYLTVNMDRFW